MSTHILHQPVRLGWLWLSLVLIGLSACQPALNIEKAPAEKAGEPTLIQSTQTAPVSSTETLPVQQQTATPVPTETKQPGPLWIDPRIPRGFRDEIQTGTKMAIVDDQNAPYRWIIAGADSAKDGTGTAWVYALVAPFPTLVDDVDFDVIHGVWQGEKTDLFAGHPIRMSQETRDAFSAAWGEPDPDGILVEDAGKLLEDAWAEKTAWAIVPFEELQPRWKVLRVNGLSPLEKSLDLKTYPLALQLHLEPSIQQETPESNWQPEKMTVLVLTGTTALVRNTALRMEREGINYPARDIGDWLTSADITHISNEVAFAESCPPGDPLRTSMVFCSRPEYMQLLKTVGADVIELTGNHELDWGPEAFLHSLGMYQQEKMRTYGGGKNLEDARKPLLLEDHGNRIAFIGCNASGPDYAWAGKDTPGSASCDREWMVDQVRQLKADGYLPIVTYQHIEDFNTQPVTPQVGDFKAMAEAGAVIVSGSQAHFPQTMTFIQDSFLHYGLGNLFFDEMDVPRVGTRREFIDRHVFYDGRYIATGLQTALLEDYSRPRPMTADERKSLLQKIFKDSGW